MSKVEWLPDKDGSLVPFIDLKGKKVRAAWAPIPGAQTEFLRRPEREVLIHGTRGGGKTQVELVDFLQHVGQGHGSAYRGILFRRTFGELADVERKTLELFKKIFPAAKYIKHNWKFPDGEQLLLRYLDDPMDYQLKYHGHEYQWLGFEELTNWPTNECYLLMFSCLRTGKKGIPLKVRATSNPGGPGHNWVKERFNLGAVPPADPASKFKRATPLGPILGKPGRPKRTSIFSDVRENFVLMQASPDYLYDIEEAARSRGEATYRAWMFGDWSIVAGGMFDDVWNPAIHVLPNTPPHVIPNSWAINRSYDHGQSAPFSVGWWAQSNGEPITVDGTKIGQIRGDLIRIDEWYGWDGNPNKGLRLRATEIAETIIQKEYASGIQGRVLPGPADSSIFDNYEPNRSVAGDMSSRGVTWERADKGPGSRVQGWQQMRKLLLGASPSNQSTRTEPGLFVTQRCEQFIRTVPTLPRSQKNPDDADTAAEDHIADEVRYRCRSRIKNTMHVRKW